MISEEEIIRDIIIYIEQDISKRFMTYKDEQEWKDYFDRVFREIKRPLQERIDKAIEYCEKELNDGRSLENQWLMGCYDTCKELLDILKGSDSNE